jgi:murein DD-endopeptidase MepM/ murein hydrolase activator NlpD
VDVRVGDRVQSGGLLGLTGNTGHSNGPHLHLEVKVGRAQTVDGVWQKLTSVHPNLLFMDNP